MSGEKLTKATDLAFYAPSEDGFNRTDIMFDAETLRWHFCDHWYGPAGKFATEKPNCAELGRELGLSDEFVRQVLNGSREPSKAFLEAAGYERVTLYRRKANPGRLAIKAGDAE